MSVAVFVNPRAGGGRAAEIWSDLVDHEPRLAAAEILLVDDLEAAITRLDDLDAGVERLIVVGGDGSAHLAVNRLRRAARTAVALGLVPAGTGSDLART
ncbi:MAG: acylglycerol kinase family protein, partial [Acidobacteriota bacterium]